MIFVIHQKGVFPVTKQIENYVEENLTGKLKQVALDFIAFLRKSNVEFYKDTCDCWNDKLYYWVKLGEEVLCFIAIKDPDEPEIFWTVWSDDCNAYEADILEDDIRCIGWEHIDFCGHCGSCGGGKQKTIFGKEFDGVCGCTFRVDNPTVEDLPFLKRMVEIRRNDILFANE